jgi:rare lipoprotein A (RlpA)-like double-psi beta-barrel protein
MRRGTPVLLLVALLVPAPVWAGPEDEIQEARESRDRTVAAAQDLAARATALTDRYWRMEAATGRATAHLIDALREELRVQAELAEARTLLGRRANAAYRAGPGAFVTVFLESTSPADFLATRKLIERTFLSNMETAGDVLEAAEDTGTQRRDLERQKVGLLRRQQALGALRQRVEARLLVAEAVAKAARVRLASLEAARRRLVDTAAAAAAAVEALAGVDQSSLLALLGPNQGRGCDLPEGLKASGASFSGTASWYGWGFAGNPTATGAIYDPRLFTAAHKTLPLNSFLRVRNGSKCALVLVNDRGPFHLDWVLDLSLGAAEYLEYDQPGTTHVSAEILEPAG